MAKRKRPHRLLVSFTDEEFSQVHAKMAEAEMYNFSGFAREMLLTGQVRHYDFTALRELTRELSHLSGNINQLVKRCNETRSIREKDVREIRRNYFAAQAILKEQIVKLLRRI